MPEPSPFVIVGAGLAGAKAAEGLREEGFDGRILLLGEEPELPYERPPLSKDYLRGESEREQARVHPEGFYAEHEIELRTGVVVAELDPGAGEIVLAGGERVGYERLLLTTGAEPRRLRLPGADLDGVHYLRDLADADRLAAGLAAAERLVVIGAGWIGAEVAASAQQMGLQVTVIERAQLPLEHVLGPELGSIYADIHRDHGVDLRLGAGLEAFEGDGRVERIRLSGDETIDCDLVVVGVGVEPRTALAEAAGLDIDNGIATSAELETSAPGVFAAGDVANAVHPFYDQPIRVEHWANAIRQGESVAPAMLGKPMPEARLPYFFSDQYEVGMEYTGLATEWEQVVFRGDPAEREFIAFWLNGGRVVAGMNVGVWDVADAIEALIRAERPVDLKRLQDPEVPIDELAGGQQTGGGAKSVIEQLAVAGESPLPAPARDYPRLVFDRAAAEPADERADDSEAWLIALRSDGAERERASERLHALLYKAACFELNRRRAALAHVRGEELEDIATQAADDALMAVLGKLDQFRGASRFTTWAYKFALLEAGVRLRRRAWQEREVVLDSEDWRSFSARGVPAQEGMERSELFEALAAAIDEELTPHQRRVFVALALNQVPIDVLAERLETSRGALYKTLHDARRKLRRVLEAEGHLESTSIPEAKT